MRKKLKILIYSPSYLPKIGGLENTSSAVAKAYVENGHEVNVITQTSLQEEQEEIEAPYIIHRQPSLWQTFKLFYWCNLVHFPNVSLKGVWPLLFLRRTFCVSHHTTNYSLDGSINFLGRLKYKVASYAHNTSCSYYTNSLLYRKGIVINSPYNEKQFFPLPTIQRNKELVFLGRLVSDKGCNLIIEALKILRDTKQIKPKFSIIGDGPELNPLKELCLQYQMNEQVEFLGSITGSILNEKLNEHQILIAPSIWEEPFGKVAIEGLAAGCKVIVSQSGGLPEAVGKLGIIFERNNSLDLAEKIELALNAPLPNKYELSQHLQKFSISTIGKKYTQWVEQSFHKNFAK